MNGHGLFRLTAIGAAFAMSALVCPGAELAGAQTKEVDEVVSPNGVAQTLALTAAQRSAIYQAVSKDKSRVASTRVPTVVGAEVPPMIELYMLPDDILAQNPVAKLYKYTMAQDQVVLVDPTNMRIIAVIGRKQHE